MIKICSLDFLNKERFDVDIKTADGRILCSAGDKITPDLLLRLYYKDIYIESWPVEEVSARVEIEQQLVSVGLGLEEEDSPEALAKAEANVSEIFKQILSNEDSEQSKVDEKLEFDEEQAKRVRDYSVRLGKILDLSKDRLNDLDKAAYYHNVGRSRLTRYDLAQKGFRKKQAAASYDILLNEKKLPEKIAEVSKLYLENYNPVSFKLDDEIPFSHIVAITSYYDVLRSQKISKDEVLKKMLQLGGNKFNIYVLHKFIQMMRENNE